MNMWYQNKSTFLANLKSEGEKSSCTDQDKKETGITWTIDYSAHLKMELRIHLEEKNLND
jgi:hypothetical protein